MISGSIKLGAIAASGDTVGAARDQPVQKTFVLVHGTLVGGWYWRRASDHLEKKGQKVFSPTLTGLGERSHLLNKDINLDTHITDIANVIKMGGSQRDLPGGAFLWRLGGLGCG